MGPLVSPFWTNISVTTGCPGCRRFFDQKYPVVVTGNNSAILATYWFQSVWLVLGTVRCMPTQSDQNEYRPQRNCFCDTARFPFSVARSAALGGNPPAGGPGFV